MVHCLLSRRRASAPAGSAVRLPQAVAASGRRTSDHRHSASRSRAGRRTAVREGAWSGCTAARTRRTSRRRKERRFLHERPDHAAGRWLTSSLAVSAGAAASRASPRRNPRRGILTGRGAPAHAAIGRGCSRMFGAAIGAGSSPPSSGAAGRRNRVGVSACGHGPKSSVAAAAVASSCRVASAAARCGMFRPSASGSPIHASAARRAAEASFGPVRHPFVGKFLGLCTGPARPSGRHGRAVRSQACSFLSPAGSAARPR
jgi:hypothetical protein